MHLGDTSINVWFVLGPGLLVATLALWGLISPSTQWPLLWGWQFRYRAWTNPRDRDAMVRRSLILPFVVAAGIVLVVGVRSLNT